MSLKNAKKMSLKNAKNMSSSHSGKEFRVEMLTLQPSQASATSLAVGVTVAGEARRFKVCLRTKKPVEVSFFVG